MPGLDQRTGDERPSRRASGPRGNPVEQGIHVNGYANGRQPLGDLAHAMGASIALHLQKLDQSRTSGIDEIAQDVDVTTEMDSRQLDAVDERDVSGLGGVPRVLQARDRVVIGHAHHANARLRCAIDQVCRVRVVRPMRSCEGAGRSSNAAT